MHFHLTKQTRIELAVLLRAGYSLRQAAKLLDVHHSTLSRELRRNRVRGKQAHLSSYHARDAQVQTTERRYRANQRFRKILPGSRLEAILVDKLRTYKWAPEQIAGWLKTCRQSLHVCAQTIYDWIYRGRKDLLEHLHCRKGKYRRTRESTLRKAFRNKQKEARSIDVRPARILARKTYGHWEGDSVVGAAQSGSIATFVERKSGYLMAALLPDKGAKSFELAAKQCFAAIPDKYRKTLTLDNGIEMSNYEAIEYGTALQVYFAHPYHSWERGTNENTNGLLRYFFPKKSSFAALTQEEIDRAVRLLNTRPRKRLNWQTPAQMLKV